MLMGEIPPHLRPIESSGGKTAATFSPQRASFCKPGARAPLLSQVFLTPKNPTHTAAFPCKEGTPSLQSLGRPSFWQLYHFPLRRGNQNCTVSFVSRVPQPHRHPPCPAPTPKLRHPQPGKTCVRVGTKGSAAFRTASVPLSPCRALLPLRAAASAPIHQRPAVPSEKSGAGLPGSQMENCREPGAPSHREIAPSRHTNTHTLRNTHTHTDPAGGRGQRTGSRAPSRAQQTYPEEESRPGVASIGQPRLHPVRSIGRGGFPGIRRAERRERAAQPGPRRPSPRLPAGPAQGEGCSGREARRPRSRAELRGAPFPGRAQEHRLPQPASTCEEAPRRLGLRCSPLLGGRG